ncbi:Penicillin-binding protein 4* (PBP 4*) (PBP 4A) (Penicillin-binding protein E), partial [Durusdinium trenchii]
MDSLISGPPEEPGMAVAVYRDGSYIYQKTFGLSNLEHEVPITDETVFDVGGLSMHFTASCILKLEDEGKLSLSDKVGDHLPDLPDYTEGEITIEHLLHHTSGLMDYLVALDMSRHSWDDSFNADEAYDLVRSQTRLGFTPGREYEYSNSNYLLLKVIVEKVSGQSIALFAKEKIFQPLGMSNTSFQEDAKVVIDNRATGYEKSEESYKISHYHDFVVPGMAVAVYRDGSYIYQKTFGLSNLEHEVPITDETVFDVGGLSMHFTASCILKLEDEGKLSLSDKVGDHLPDLPDYTEGEITIEHLLHHTSGLMDYLVALDMSRHSWDDSFNADEAYDLVRSQTRLGFTPGREYEYSNSNYLLLKVIVEKVSGQSIALFAKEKIFQPLGMSNTSFQEDAKVVIDNRATGYEKSEESYKISHYHDFVVP